MPATLLDKLVQIQTERGLSDRAFARVLHVSHSLWVKTRSRSYPIRYQLLAGVVLAFPHLEPDVLSHLRRSTGARKAVPHPCTTAQPPARM
jgi:hypothetical protein